MSIFQSKGISATSSKDPRNFVFEGQTYKVALDTETGAPVGVTWYAGKQQSFLGGERLSQIGSPAFVKASETAAKLSQDAFKAGKYALQGKTGKNGTYNVLVLKPTA